MQVKDGVRGSVEFEQCLCVGAYFPGTHVGGGEGGPDALEDLGRDALGKGEHWP